MEKWSGVAGKSTEEVWRSDLAPFEKHAASCDVGLVVGDADRTGSHELLADAQLTRPEC